MRQLLYILCLLPLGVRADTLHIVDLGFTTLYVQVLDVVDDSAMIANGWEKRGNAYVDKIVHSDGDTFWVGCGDDMYMAVPVEYDILMVVQKYDHNGSGVTDISDLMMMIDYYFGPFD